MSVYLSGPMRGLPDFNFPAFDAAAVKLRTFGYTVINPAESFEGQTDLDWSTYMRKDIQDLLTVDTVVVLPNWENSPGCRVELSVAYALGLPIFPWVGKPMFDLTSAMDVSWLVHEQNQNIAATTDQQTVLQEANNLIYGDRQKAYGHPYDDFARTAGFWSTLFGVDVKPEQVSMAMMLLKISRLMQHTKRDSIVDVAGYAGTLQMVLDEKEARNADST